MENNFVYLKNMEQSLVDKMFFLDHNLPIDRLIDVGCADGKLLCALAAMNYPAELVGYDTNGEFLEEARQNDPHILWKDNLFLPYKPNTAILLSSILHEVYHYLTNEEIEEFWSNIFALRPSYIIVRDMYYSPGAGFDVNWGKVTGHSLWQDFELSRGSSYKLLVEFLLKYRYGENWEREKMENYFSWNFMMLPAQLNCIYRYHYILPFIAGQVKRDFGINIPENTHVKAIFTLENNA